MQTCPHIARSAQGDDANQSELTVHASHVDDIREDLLLCPWDHTLSYINTRIQTHTQAHTHTHAQIHIHIHVHSHHRHGENLEQTLFPLHQYEFAQYFPATSRHGINVLVLECLHENCAPAHTSMTVFTDHVFLFVFLVRRGRHRLIFAAIPIISSFEEDIDPCSKTFLS